MDQTRCAYIIHFLLIRTHAAALHQGRPDRNHPSVSGFKSVANNATFALRIGFVLDDA